MIKITEEVLNFEYNHRMILQSYLEYLHLPLGGIVRQVSSEVRLWTLPSLQSANPVDTKPEKFRISRDPQSLPHQPWYFGWRRAKNSELFIAAQPKNSVLFHDVRGSFVYHTTLTDRVSKYVSCAKKSYTNLQACLGSNPYR